MTEKQKQRQCKAVPSRLGKIWFNDHVIYLKCRVTIENINYFNNRINYGCVASQSKISNGKFNKDRKETTKRGASFCSAVAAPRFRAATLRRRDTACKRHFPVGFVGAGPEEPRGKRQDPVKRAKSEGLRPDAGGFPATAPASWVAALCRSSRRQRTSRGCFPEKFAEVG